MSSPVLSLPQPAADTLPRGLLIITRYLGSTNTRGSRISATCSRDSETTYRASVPYPHDLNTLDAHYYAALACLARIEEANGYFNFTIQAIAPTDRGYAFLTSAHDRG